MSGEVKRVRLSIEEPGGVDREMWPITQGVPFTEGELERGDPVRVVADDGKELPAQAFCQTTWHPDLKYVKWLLVDFQVDLPANQTKEVFLEYGPGVRPVPPEQAVTVEKIDEVIRIDTGEMQVDFRRGDPDFMAACRLRTSDGWRNLIRGKPGPYLYMSDQWGSYYDSCSGAPPPEILVEDSGPLRASVCIKGFHASDDGRRFCPYVLRVHLYAGRSDMHVYHTFVFDQDVERIELSEVGVSFPLELGSDLRMAFGGEERSHWATRFEEGRILQTSDIAYRVNRDEEPFGSGGKTQGWGCLSGDAGSAVAVIRDMWKEYPKGIRIDSDGIDVQIWPMEYGQTLKFSTPWKEWPVFFNGTRDEAEFKRLVEEKPTAPLNLKSTGAGTPEELLWVEEMVAKYAPDRPACYNDTGTNNGFGAAKTTEFHLQFSADRISDGTAETLGICVQEPVIAPADVSYACGTGAMRTMAPIDKERFAEAEKGLDGLFERIVTEPRHVLRTYGMIDYGDLMCSHSGSPASMWLNFKDEPDIIERMKHCARSYNNEANDQVNALWSFFVHTGQRKYFLAAEAYGEHMADLDIIHVYPDGTPGGVMHYHNCEHWTGGYSPSHTCLAGLMLQYYLTGNRRILDVCREVADWILARQEPCGIYRNKGTLVREFTTPVANLLEVYQATWDNKYGDLARRSLKWLFLALPEPGSFPESIYTAGERGDEAEVEQDGWHLRQAGGMTPQMLYDGHRLFGKDDPIYKEALLGMSNHFIRGPEPVIIETFLVGPKKVMRIDPYFNGPLIAYSYEVTQDPVYAAFCRYYIREHFPTVSEQTTFTYVCWGSIIPPMMEAVRKAENKHSAEELDRLEQEWIQEVEDVAKKLTKKPGLKGRPKRRSLGVIKGYE